MKHKILFLISAFLYVVSIAQANTTAIIVNNISYTLNNTDNTASITGNFITHPIAVVIPDTVSSNSIIYKVTSIANSAFINNLNLTGKLTILASLTSIGTNAFSGCTQISDTLSFPSSLTSIGASAFTGCTGLKAIFLPSAVTSIAANTFQNCNKVTKIVIPTTITTIGDYAFDGCTSLTDTTAISSNVTSIGVSSFRNCKIGLRVDPSNAIYTSTKGLLYNKNRSTLIQVPISFTGIDTIPASVTSIGNYAFYKCTSLTGIVLPSSLTTIGNYSFSGCSYIATILNIPASVTSIGKYAFQGCSRMTNVVSPTIRICMGSFDAAATKFTLTGSIDARDFKFLRDSTSAKTLDLGSATIVAYTGTGGTNTSGVTPVKSATYPANTIPQYAFSYPGTLALITSANPIITISGKSELTSIVFPTAVTALDIYSFATCTGLAGTFNIPSTATSIGNGAFLDCAGVTNFTLPTALISIGDNAFERCIGLKQSIVFPASLTTIGSYTFSACNNIPGRIDLPESVTTVGTYAFQSCRKITSITFPTTLKIIPAGICSNCDTLSNVNFREGSTSIGSNAFEYCSKLTSVVIPTTVTTLGNYAFYECIGLTDVTLPTTLAKIDTYTFYSCANLKNITLPSSLTTIGDYAFYGCSSLTDIPMPATLKTLGQYTFSCCTKLTNITVSDLVTALPNYIYSGCTNLINITLPSGLLTIGTYTFQNCNSLTTAILPNTLKTIGADAFVNCTALSNVTIPATVTSIGNYAFTNCSAPLFVDPNNAIYSSADSILFNKTLTTLIQCPIFKTGSYTIPSTVTTLGDYSFYFSKLNSIFIPSSVTTIGNAVFFNCSGLTSITTNSSAPIDLNNSTDVFHNINTTCTLYVPFGSKAQYQAAAQWNGINKIVEATTAVNNPSEIKSKVYVSNGQLIVSNIVIGKSIDIYNLSGCLVSQTIANSDKMTINIPAKGIYIVRIDNQSTKIVND